MMLEWLGQNQAAAALRRAVEDAFADGNLTEDLGGNLNTAELTAAIIERVELISPLRYNSESFHRPKRETDHWSTSANDDRSLRYRTPRRVGSLSAPNGPLGT